MNGAVLAFLALTTVQAVAIRPYLPPDELYHVGDAASLLEDRLPTLTTPLPGERVPLMPGDRQRGGHPGLGPDRPDPSGGAVGQLTSRSVSGYR